MLPVSNSTKGGQHRPGALSGWSGGHGRHLASPYDKEMSRNDGLRSMAAVCVYDGAGVSVFCVCL